MILNLKKYIYLINDVTNMLLGKERLNFEKNMKKLKQAVVVLGVALVASLLLNIYLLIIK